MAPVVVRYKDGYWIKVSFSAYREREDEGNGWSSAGTGPLVYASSVARIKHLGQVPKTERTKEQLNEIELQMFNQQIEKWESSPNHKSMLNSNCSIKDLSRP